jgi:hypothetical protein
LIECLAQAICAMRGGDVLDRFGQRHPGRKHGGQFAQHQRQLRLGRPAGGADRRRRGHRTRRSELDRNQMAPGELFDGSGLARDFERSFDGASAGIDRAVAQFHPEVRRRRLRR